MKAKLPKRDSAVYPNKKNIMEGNFLDSTQILFYFLPDQGPLALTMLDQKPVINCIELLLVQAGPVL